MAFGNISFGTRFGESADKAGPAKARAIPSATATPVRICQPGQGYRAKQLQRYRQPCDVATIEPVRGKAGKWRQQEQWEELQQADQRQLARCLGHAHPAIAGDIIGLPADDQHHRILRQRHREASGPESAEIGKAKRGGWLTHSGANGRAAGPCQGMRSVLSRSQAAWTYSRHDFGHSVSKADCRDTTTLRTFTFLQYVR